MHWLLIIINATLTLNIDLIHPYWEHRLLVGCSDLQKSVGHQRPRHHFLSIYCQSNSPPSTPPPHSLHLGHAFSSRIPPMWELILGWWECLLIKFGHLKTRYQCLSILVISIVAPNPNDMTAPPPTRSTLATPPLSWPLYHERLLLDCCVVASSLKVKVLAT